MPKEKTETEPEVTETPTEGTKSETEVKTEPESTVPESPDDIPELGEEGISQLLKDDDDSESEGEEATESPEPTPEPKPEGEVKDEPVPVKTEEKAPPAAEKPAEAKPAVEPIPVPEPVPVPVKTEPVQPAAETPPAEPPAEVKPALTAEEQTEGYKEWRGKTEETLASTHYALSEEEVRELDITPEFGKMISTHSARVYMDAVTGAIGHILASMPQLLEAALVTRDATAKGEAAFYAAWPQLNSAEHGVSISRIGHSYRSLNPKVDTETFIRDVGAQAIIALRIPTEAPTVPGTPPASVVEPVVPETPVQPFKPAGSATPGGGREAPESGYSALTREFDEEEAAEFG